jgi:hypothetical protein
MNNFTAAHRILLWLVFMRVTFAVRLTSRIRRRRAGGVADTTDSLRAVACIRFVRRWLVVVVVVHGSLLSGSGPKRRLATWMTGLPAASYEISIKHPMG